jgi:hypothetical protein
MANIPKRFQAPYMRNVNTGIQANASLYKSFIPTSGLEKFFAKKQAVSENGRWKTD